MSESTNTANQRASEATPLLSSTTSGSSQPQPSQSDGPSLLQKIEDFFPHPFSASALSSLPNADGDEPSSSQAGIGSRLLNAVGLGSEDQENARGKGKGSARVKAKRRDRIPDVGEDGQQPLLRNYSSISYDTRNAREDEIMVRVPKKLATPIKVEQKVWLANERTWISYLSIAILTSTLSLGLWNASDKGSIGRWFGGVYAVISVIILIYGYAIFQRRLTMISSRDAGQFDQLWGPLLMCGAIFIALVVNFALRWNEMKNKRKESVADVLRFW